METYQLGKGLNTLPMTIRLHPRFMEDAFR